MKKINRLLNVTLFISCSLLFLSCDDFLDKTPEVQPAPEDYFNETSQLMAYLDGLYDAVLPGHGANTGSSTTGWDYGLFGADNHTDNQASGNPNDRYIIGLWKVGSGKGDWDFGTITQINLFFQGVMPKYESNSIKGKQEQIDHLIGEAHFLRAFQYFKKLRSYGDFPIITEVLPDSKEILIENSKRKPRNEVARFIISELDKAIEYMQESGWEKTRLTRDAAYLMKSRVALYEGTWLKYFKGTAFVPQGEGWPGKKVDYNADYVYPSGSIDQEIDFFLSQAMEASKVVAEKYHDKLTPNTGTIQQEEKATPNRYMDMFGSEDLSDYDEVILWRQYKRGFVRHSAVYSAQRSNAGIGLTKGMVDAFVMKDGLPIYVSRSFLGDDITPVNSTSYHYNNRIDRDTRLSLFLKEPGQKNILIEDESVSGGIKVEPLPNIRGDANYVTGYALRKGNSYDGLHAGQGNSPTAAVIFRAAEALLNYMEASYEKNQTIDAFADKYWRALRTRAMVDPDYQKTINATDMGIEKLSDWGAYSAGKLLTDATLFNIRRERRCEFMAEAFRYMDLCRWRAMEQMIDEPYHILGFKAFNSGLDETHTGEDGKTFKYFTFTAANMSDPNDNVGGSGDYFHIYRKDVTNNAYNGYRWKMAHYLNPIGIGEMILTSSNGKADGSVIYQNPYWPIETDVSALE